jgi:hypothetical protein
VNIGEDQPFTATMATIREKEYWESKDEYYKRQEPFVSLERIAYMVIKHHYINKYFAEWGWV